MTEMVDIPPQDIAVANRLRPVGEHWVAALAKSMAETGLHAPLVVRRRQGGTYVLVAGAHRLAAALSLNWSTVACTVAHLDDLQARMIEIEENLVRNELDALDRMFFIAEHETVYLAIHPEAAHGKAKKRSKKNSMLEKSQTLRLLRVPRFSAVIAKKIGLSERTIQQSAALAKALDPAAVALLRQTALAANFSQLLALSQQEPEIQVRIAALIAAGKATSVAKARVAAGLDTPKATDPQMVLYVQIIGLLGKCSAQTLAGVATHMAGLKPNKKEQRP